MTIEDVYIHYKIMPSLRMHMYRVAAVAKTICELYPEVVEKKDIVTACLLHDMGNIIKFRLELFPQFLEPEGFEYWQKVQQDYLTKYGVDEHIATLEIVQEVGQSERIYKLVDGFRFSQLEETLKKGDITQMICSYSDMRVQPMGIVSLEERLEDGRKRFRLRQQESSNELFDRMSKALNQMESILFEDKNICPADITDTKVEPVIYELKHFEIT